MPNGPLEQDPPHEAPAGVSNDPMGGQRHGSGAVLEIVGDAALAGARAFGGLVLQVIGIAVLLVLGAAGVGAGLWLGMGWLAIAGGVLIAGALLWALVLAFILYSTSW